MLIEIKYKNLHDIVCDYLIFKHLLGNDANCDKCFWMGI